MSYKTEFNLFLHEEEQKIGDCIKKMFLKENPSTLTDPQKLSQFLINQIPSVMIEMLKDYDEFKENQNF